MDIFIHGSRASVSVGGVAYTINPHVNLVLSGAPTFKGLGSTGRISVPNGKITPVTLPTVKVAPIAAGVSYQATSLNQNFVRVTYNLKPLRTKTNLFAPLGYRLQGSFPRLVTSFRVRAPQGFRGALALPSMRAGGEMTVPTHSLRQIAMLPHLGLEGVLSVPQSVRGGMTLPALGAAGELDAYTEVRSSAKFSALRAYGRVGSPPSITLAAAVPSLGMAAITYTYGSKIDAAAKLPTLGLKGELTKLNRVKAEFMFPAISMRGSAQQPNKHDSAFTLPRFQLVGKATQPLMVASAGSLPRLGTDFSVGVFNWYASAPSLPKIASSGRVTFSSKVSGAGSFPLIQTSGYVDASYFVRLRYSLKKMSMSLDVKYSTSVRGGMMLPLVASHGLAQQPLMVESKASLRPLSVSGSMREMGTWKARRGSGYIGLMVL